MPVLFCACVCTHPHAYVHTCVTTRLHILAYVFTYVCVYSDCTVLGTVPREDAHVHYGWNNITMYQYIAIFITAIQYNTV